MDLKPFIRTIPDFPHPDVMHRDITPLLSNNHAFFMRLKHCMEDVKHSYFFDTILARVYYNTLR